MKSTGTMKKMVLVDFNEYNALKKKCTTNSDDAGLRQKVLNNHQLSGKARHGIDSYILSNKRRLNNEKHKQNEQRRQNDSIQQLINSLKQMDMKNNNNNTNQPPPKPSPPPSPPHSFSWKSSEDEDDDTKDGGEEEEYFVPPIQSTPQQSDGTPRPKRKKRRKQADVDASRAAKLINRRSPVQTRLSKTQVASSTARKKKAAESKQAKQRARLTKSFNQSGSGLSHHHRPKPRWIRLPFN